MTSSDLGQMFNLRKTTAAPPRLPEPQPEADSSAEASTPAPPSPAPGETAPRGVGGKSSPPQAPSTTVATKKAAKRVAAKPAGAAAPPGASERAAADAAAEPDTAALEVAAAAPAGEGRPRSATSTGGRASIMLYTTQKVRERMKEEANRTSLSYGQLTLLCIESTLDRLEKVFAARAGATSQLFSTDYKPRSTGETRSANLNLHIARRDLEVVESLWQRFPGCRSRNDLLSTACALHLTGEGDA